MKEFRCHICKCYLGEMTQGKIKKGAIILCTECMDKYKAYKGVADVANMNGDIKGSKGTSNFDTTEFFNGIFK